MGTWTDKKIEKLKILWEKGIPTAEIGKRLDFSKNAIVGKVHRLGLSNRNSPIKTSANKVKKEAPKKMEVSSSVKNTKIVQNVKKSAEIEEKITINEEIVSAKNESRKFAEPVAKAKKTNIVGVPLSELTSDLCCWPIDDVNSEDFHFCGKKVFKNKPYCLEHCALAYTNSASQSEEKEVETRE